MPRLRKHKAKDGYYILTRIGNQIVTYQLAKEGWERLQAAGIDVDQCFGRALLLDLYRNGEVFTHGTGPGQIAFDADARQLEFDFSDDPEPETNIPCCSECCSLDDLHLVTVVTDENTTATILCPVCRVSAELGGVDCNGHGSAQAVRSALLHRHPAPVASLWLSGCITLPSGVMRYNPKARERLPPPQPGGFVPLSAIFRLFGGNR